MKKILSIIFPCILISTLIYVDRFVASETSGYILVWIYFMFPLIFIIQGLVCSNSLKSMTIGFLLSSISVILPISMWYKMGSMIVPVIIYLLLGLIVAHLKNNIHKRKNK